MTSRFVLLRIHFTISWLCFSTLLPSPWRPPSPRRTEARASICCPMAPCAWPPLRAIYSPGWTSGNTVLTWWPRWASQRAPRGGESLLCVEVLNIFLKFSFFLTDFCVCDDPVLWLQFGDGPEKMEDVKGGKHKLVIFLLQYLDFHACIFLFHTTWSSTKDGNIFLEAFLDGTGLLAWRGHTRWFKVS